MRSPPCSNDAFDADTGVDSTKPESVVNLLGGNKARVLLLANLALAAGVAVMAHSMASVVSRQRMAVRRSVFRMSCQDERRGRWAHFRFTPRVSRAPPPRSLIHSKHS